jgi:IS30 family transposase
LTAHITNEQRQLARRLQASGKSLREIAREVGVSTAGVHVMLRGQSREARPDAWVPARGRLTMADREEIMLGLDRGESLRVIARRLERSPSTVSREVVANGGRDGYRIWPAHQHARFCTRRHRSTKLDDRVLCEKVTSWLEEIWSPDEISRRLRREFPDDATMQISHEAIYQSLYVQSRGELRRELTRCLRSGRAKRRPQGQSEKRTNIANMVMISERHAEVEDRAVPGHWEGDLVRHEALFNRAVMKGHRRQVVAAA